MLEQRSPETKDMKPEVVQQGTLFDKATLEQLKKERRHWEETAVEKSQQRMPEHAIDLELRRVRLRRKVGNRLRNRRQRQVWGDQIEAPISDGPPQSVNNRRVEL